MTGEEDAMPGLPGYDTDLESDRHPEENRPVDSIVSPDGLVLIELSRMCMHSDLPRSFSELNSLIWRAFDLGKEYRDKGGKD